MTKMVAKLARKSARPTRSKRPPPKLRLVVPQESEEPTARALSAIGARIRDVRKARGLTLQALADACSLSQSMLSLVERGRTAPSLASLMVVANALGVPMSTLIVDQAEAQGKLIIRRDEQPVVQVGANIERRLLREDREHGITISLNEYAPNRSGKAKSITHDGFEYGLVIAGSLTIEVNGVAHVLEQGDLISYPSRKPHRIWNHGKTKVVTLWINLQHD